MVLSLPVLCKCCFRKMRKSSGFHLWLMTYFKELLEQKGQAAHKIYIMYLICFFHQKLNLPVLQFNNIKNYILSSTMNVWNNKANEPSYFSDMEYNLMKPWVWRKHKGGENRKNALNLLVRVYFFHQTAIV